MVMAAGFAVAGGLLRRRRIAPALTAGLTAGAAFFIVFGGWLAPAVEPLRLSRNLANAVNEIVRPGDQVLLCGYEEPSTFYYIRAPARPADSLEVALLLHGSQDPFVLALSSSGLAAFEDALRSSPLLVGQQHREVDGFNYVKSQRVTLSVSRHAGREEEGGHE
jgi:hypothetical protein